jgi:anti-anti-sigma factor
MTSQICNPREITELVRGTELKLIARVQPLVLRQSVTLDLEHIARIDAAGVAALITLYCDACQAGNQFAIANPSAHVREIIELVGLDRILMALPEAVPSLDDAVFEETAA